MAGVEQDVEDEDDDDNATDDDDDDDDQVQVVDATATPPKVCASMRATSSRSHKAPSKYFAYLPDHSGENISSYFKYYEL